MRIGIIGAGVAGLMAGRSLIDAGHDVVMVDKGRSPGGRLATRRLGGARLDHGAQFFTVRNGRFRTYVDEWIDDGVVAEWCRGFDPVQPDGFPRYCCPTGMNTLAKHLARGLDVRCSTMAFAVRPTADGTTGWTILIDDGTTITVDALIVTTPVPQAYALLITSGVKLPEELTAMDYDRTIALLAVLDRPGDVPSPGGIPRPGGIFSFIGDNRMKGISTVPAITFHADGTWSEAHWDDHHAALDAALREAAMSWLGGATIVESQVKKWRFATPRTPWPDRCWIARESVRPLILAGDAYGEPRVEGAALSGLDAADAIIALGSTSG